MNTTQKSKKIEYKILGDIFPVLTISLPENSSILADSGCLSWISGNIKVNSTFTEIKSLFSRIFLNETFSLNKYTCTSGNGIVSISPQSLGKIIAIDLKEKNQPIYFKHGSFFAAEETVKISTDFNKLKKAGLFGISNILTEKIEGNSGKAFLFFDSNVIELTVKDNQEFLVEEQNLIAFDDSVTISLKNNFNLLNFLFSKNSIFLYSVTGNGKVWLSSKNTKNQDNFFKIGLIFKFLRFVFSIFLLIILFFYMIKN